MKYIRWGKVRNSSRGFQDQLSENLATEKKLNLRITIVKNKDKERRMTGVETPSFLFFTGYEKKIFRSLFQRAQLSIVLIFFCAEASINHFT